MKSKKMKVILNTELKITKQPNGTIYISIGGKMDYYRVEPDNYISVLLSEEMLNIISRINEFGEVKNIKINQNIREDGVEWSYDARREASIFIDKKLREMGLVEGGRFEVWRPKEHGETYYFAGHGEVDKFLFDDDDRDKNILSIGKGWKTRAEAQKELDKLLATEKIRKWTTRENEGWTPDWENTEQIKHTTAVCSRGIAWDNVTSIRYIPDNFMYVKSREIAQKMIIELEEELKIYWGIK